MSARMSRLVHGLVTPQVARLCAAMSLIVLSIAQADAQETAQPSPSQRRAARVAQLAPCFQASSKRWGVDPVLLQAIARVESDFNAQAVHVNADGSTDFGVMQVNSSHLPRLGLVGITSVDLLKDACLNIDIGASILADTLHQFGPTWRAVGAYGAGNSGSASKELARGQYVGKVYRALMTREAQRELGGPQRVSTVSSAASATAPRTATVAQMQVLE